MKGKDDLQNSIDKLDTIKKKFVKFYKRDEVRGNVSMSCQASLISRQTYYDWLEKDETFRKAIYDAKMSMCDDMEQVLIARAVEKDTTALIFWLKYNHPQYKEQPIAQVNVFTQVLNGEREEFKL